MTDTGEDTKPPSWVGRATAPPSADPWPTTEQPVYAPPVVYTQPGQPPIMYVNAPPRRRGLTALLIVVGVLAACCAGGATFALLSSAAIRDAVGLGPAAPAAPSNPPPASQPTTPPPPTVPAPAGLNTPVRDGKFQFVVTSVDCGHKSVGVGPISRKAQGQYCLVGLSVENVSDSGQLLLDGAQVGIAADGTEYTPDSAAGFVANANASTWINMIEPGKTVNGTIVYDLPKGGELARLELHDSPFSGGVTVTLA
jgi:uncharacterized protein DUF4352